MQKKIRCVQVGDCFTISSIFLIRYMGISCCPMHATDVLVGHCDIYYNCIVKTMLGVCCMTF